MFKKRNVDMFGEEQHYFENRQAEPMNEAFYEEHFDSSASVYGVNEDLSDKKKEPKQLKKDKKLNLTAKNYLYPLSSVGFYTTLIIAEIAAFFICIELEQSLSTPVRFEPEMLFVVAALLAVAVYVAFIFISVPVLKAKQKAREAIKSAFGYSQPKPVNNSQPASNNTALKDMLRKNKKWLIIALVISIFATSGFSLIMLAIFVAAVKGSNKYNKK